MSTRQRDTQERQRQLETYDRFIDDLYHMGRPVKSSSRQQRLAFPGPRLLLGGAKPAGGLWCRPAHERAALRASKAQASCAITRSSSEGMA
jgi:hypothetical protein